MKVLKTVKKRNLIIFLVLVFSFLLVHIAQAVTAEPGTDANPLVTQDYVDTKINDLTAKYTELKIASDNLIQQMGSLQKSQVPKFQILERVPVGKKIICGASTELILRGGDATAIGSDKGGISNLISGKDLKTGELVPRDQLILIPRDDGRGITITREAWVMIKGEYTIQ